VEMKLICAFFAALTALLGSQDGVAQSVYPDKAIRILVGFPAGGPPDIAARLLADKFAEAWGKPVRRPMPSYAQNFCEALAAYMREVLPITRPSSR
jgi:hypothetical protein